MSAGGLCMHGSMPSECVRCADRIVINELRAERDALWKERDYAIEQHDKIIKERDALRALLDRVLSCTDLHGWNGATAELLCADIDAALAEGKP